MEENRNQLPCARHTVIGESSALLFGSETELVRDTESHAPSRAVRGSIASLKAGLEKVWVKELKDWFLS